MKISQFSIDAWVARIERHRFACLCKREIPVSLGVDPVINLQSVFGDRLVRQAQGQMRALASSGCRATSLPIKARIRVVIVRDVSDSTSSGRASANSRRFAKSLPRAQYRGEPESHEGISGPLSSQINLPRSAEKRPALAAALNVRRHPRWIRSPVHARTDPGQVLRAWAGRVHRFILAEVCLGAYQPGDASRPDRRSPVRRVLSLATVLNPAIPCVLIA